MDTLSNIALIGIGATALVDAWSIARRAWLRIALPDYGQLGRWLAHMGRGRFRHRAIAEAAPVHGERILGWTAHYAIGIAFAAIVPALFGTPWLHAPTLAPALAVGIASVAAPFLLMQPGMGAGVAARRSARPRAARLQSLATHVVFGLGMYATAVVIAFAQGR